MTKKAKYVVRPKTANQTLGGFSADVTITGPKRSKAGGEVWRVASGKQARTIVSSRSSTATMDEASRRYGKALQRLAKR
jgi:hypothetical protein